jgi:HAD superfamily hydrolase (TIGR01549 family)
MRYKAAIFDLEGTLIHTTFECISKIVSQAFQDFGVKISDEEIRNFWFSHKREELVKKILKIENPEIFWEVFRKYDILDLRKQHTKAYSDTNFISELKQEGLKIGIVTGSPRYTISLATEIFGKDSFDAVIRTHVSEGIKEKPDPHGILECLKILGISNEEAIFVGNGDEDILAAKNANVFDVLIDRGEHDLIKETPSLKIHSLYELRDFLGF